MLTQKRKKEIENLTLDILKNTDMLNMVPVDLNKIANYLDIKLIEGSFIEQGISGGLINDRGRYVAITKRSDIYTRKRFTIAHEIGHYILHRDKIGKTHMDTILFRSDNEKTEIEEEADFFAASLLMERNALKKLNKEIKSKSILANIFNVSQQALEIRLKEI